MRKRLTSILLTLAMLVGLLPALSPQAEAAADDATALLQEVSTKTSVPSGYTPIYDAEDLANIANDMTGKYILMNDIDLSGIDWQPLKASSPGGYTSGFTGILEGNGYTIRNLSCTDEVSAGLFDENYNGTIQNLALTGTVTVANTNHFNGYAAGLCASNFVGGIIKNCTVAATITNAGSTYTTDVAGIAASNFGTISYCRFTGTIRAVSGGDAILDVNGAAALGGWGEITAGGIAATHYSDSPLTACEMTGNILLQGNVEDVYAGGLVAKDSGSLDQCRVTGTISLTGKAKTPTLEIGGLAGKTRYQCQYTDCSFNGTISIALSLSDIGSYPIYRVGGLFAESISDATIKNCYASGTILDSSTDETGALTVLGTPAWCVSYLFSGDNKDFSGIYYPSGTFEAFDQPVTPSTGYTAVPLASMASKATFPKYDFSSVWTMGQSYPIQKVFTHLSNGSSTPVAKPAEDTAVIDASEYIQQHVSFAQSNSYSQQS